MFHNCIIRQRRKFEREHECALGKFPLEWAAAGLYGARISLLAIPHIHSHCQDRRLERIDDTIRLQDEL